MEHTCKKCGKTELPFNWPAADLCPACAQGAVVFAGLSVESDKYMQIMEQVLLRHQRSVVKSCMVISPEVGKEIIEIGADGIRKMEGASVGCAPLQKLIVGIGYTLNALREWREKGPL